MNNFKTTAELKGLAKERSLGRYGTLIGANIIIFLIQVLASSITTISSGGNLAIIIINNVITLIISILLGTLMSGKAYLYMNLMYSQSISTSDIFFGFRQQPQKAVVIQSVFVLVDFIVSIPMQIFMIMYRQSGSNTALAAVIVAFVVGLAINLAVNLIYSQAFFLLHDFPSRSAKELLATSRRLMQGNIFRLFILYLSFIPLYILGFITLAIPLLWVSVYRYASCCAFYQDLIAGSTGASATVTE
jgi:uncharacterized membrane protein